MGMAVAAMMAGCMAIFFLCIGAYLYVEDRFVWTGAFLALAMALLALTVACVCAAERHPTEEVRCSTIEGAKYSSSDKACYKNGVKLNFNEDGVDE